MKTGQLQKNLYRFKRLCGREELKLLIDVSHCNLRCSLCPRGGVSGLKNDAKGLMTPDLFRRMIDKFRNERVRIRELEIGNWGEPLLNKDLPEMIRYVKKEWPPAYMGRPGSVGISSNMTCLFDPLKLLESGVDRIRVSISGMTQETYSRNHVGGNIDTVLKNISELARIRKERGFRHVALGIGFHDLLYNKSESGLARKFCEERDLSFTLLPMYISSVEENIIFYRQKDLMSKHYSAFIDLEGEMKLMKTAERIEKCQFRRSVIVVNFNGELVRCCGVYGPEHLMGSLFDRKIRDVPKIKSPICAVCGKTPMSWR